MKEQVQIDYNLYYEESNFDDLKQAITTLTTATEQQFQTIKNEKWYTRLFNCITFSKKNSKRMASQIDSLAQAQQILTEILIRLSAKDAQVATLVYQNFQDIKKLSENDIYLEAKIRYMENSLILGIHTSEDIRELSKTSKQVLSGCFYELSSIYSDSSIEQQEYANNVLNFIGFISSDSKVDNLDLAIETLEEKDRRIILTCCIEYMFLYELETAFPEEVNCFIEKFDIGNKTIKNIEDKITATYDLRGPNGIIEKYSQITFEAINENGFFVEMDDLIENEEDDEAEEIEQSSDISQEYSGLLLKFMEDKKAYKSDMFLETKDYCVWANRKFGEAEATLNCYSKKSNGDISLTKINSIDMRVFSPRFTFDNKKYTVDYNNNMVFYVKDNLLHKIDIENDVEKIYENTPCDNDISFLQAQDNYVIMVSPNNLYCFDLEKETIFEVTDAQGKSITNTIYGEKITTVLCDENIYFYSSSGCKLCSDDGGSLNNAIAKYNIKNKIISRVQSANIKKMFVALGEIYVIASQDNDYDNYYLFKLIEQDGSYILKDLIKFPISEVRVSENYLLYYINNNIWSKDNDLYSIYAFDFRKQACKKVVEDCCLYRKEGIIKPKYIRQKSIFKALGNWVYYIKDHLVFQMNGPTLIEHHIHRININVPLQDADLGKESDY